MDEIMDQEPKLRRRFNKSERVALYLAAQGLCALCEKPLDHRWEADHVKPFHLGGDTDVINAQALCRGCNRRKGGTLDMASSSDFIDPYLWQKEFHDHYMRGTLQDYLLEGTPGCGKTRAALFAASSKFKENPRLRFIIVVPSVSLKRQWAGAAAEHFGLQLKADWEPDEGFNLLNTGFDGILVTYAAVAAKDVKGFMRCREMLQKICRMFPAMVIFDEIHHAGGDQAWADAIQKAFEPADYRLCLSGTPFRHDNLRIPFITYDENGRSKANFSYSYGRGLREENCRPIFFESQNGHIEYIYKSEYVNTTFHEGMSESERSNAVKTALDPRNPWVSDLMHKAYEEHQRIRRDSQPNSAILIIATDHGHARKLHPLIKRVTGRDPVLVLSDDPDAHDKIKRFAESAEEVILAVKMVSEGIDIPRLRVLVYLTNVMTELFFRQAAGRIVRKQRGYDDQNAYFYMPELPDLIEYAKDIGKERDHYILSEDDDDSRGVKETNGNQAEGVQDFLPIGAKALPGQSVFDGEAYDPQEMSSIISSASQVGIALDGPFRVKLAEMQRKGFTISFGSSTEGDVSNPQKEKPLWEEIRSLKQEISAMVKSLGRRLESEQPEIKEPYQAIHKWFMGRQGMRLPACNDLLKLEERKSQLRKWLTEEEPFYG